MATPARPRPTDSELALARDLLALGPQFGKLAWRAAGQCRIASPERSRLLGVLAEGPLRPGHVAKRLRLAPATVTELVDALVGEGLIRRGVDADDRRAIVLELTPEGRRQRQQFEQAAAALLADVVARLRPPQQRRLHAAFADIHAAFTAASHDDETVRRSTPREKHSAR